MHDDEQNDEASRDEVNGARRLRPPKKSSSHGATESTPGDIVSPDNIISGKKQKTTACKSVSAAHYTASPPRRADV